MNKILSTILVLASLGALSGLAQSDRFPALTKAGTDMVRDQPNMGIALCALKKAREHLQAATADKAGRRVEALQAVDGAIDEACRAVAYARDNKEGKFSPPAAFREITVASFEGLTKEGTQRNPGQPNMGTAYVALDQALEYLRKAEADKGGHRVKAVSLTETARTEVQQGIEVGKKN